MSFAKKGGLIMFTLDRGDNNNLGFNKLYVIPKMAGLLKKLIGKVFVNARFSEFLQASLFIINTHC